MNSPRVLRSTALIVLLVVLASGCSVFGYRIRSPITREAEEVRFGPGKLTAAAVQSEIMSFTGTFDAAVAEQRCAHAAGAQVAGREPFAIRAARARAHAGIELDRRVHAIRASLR